MTSHTRVRLVLAAFILTLVSIVPFRLTFSSLVSADTNQMNVWWPTPAAHMTGVQPFKVMIPSLDVSQYDTYWQVDGGQLNPMQNSYTDYQHKEASVDLSGWTWRGSGPYTVTFVAKEGSTVVSQQSVEIYVDNGMQSATVAPPTPSTNQLQTIDGVNQPNPSPTPSTNQSLTTMNGVNQPVATSPAQTTTTPPPPPPPPPSASIQVWWPTSGANISGVQPFKALLPNTALDSYTMYWQVDGGQLNPMSDNSTDSLHKEASVDVSSWNWQSSGVYTLTFVAKDSNGHVIATQQEQVLINAPAGSQISSDPQPTVTVAVTSPVTISSTPAPTSPTTSTPAPTSPAPTPSRGNPLAGDTFYVDPGSSAAQQAATWQSTDPTDAARMETLAQTPTAQWFGDWTQNIAGAVHSAVTTASAAGQVPVLVAYDIPERDCGGYSSGGASSPSAYESWIAAFAEGIGNGKAVVVLEPDALASITCLSSADQQTRLGLLSDAVTTLKHNPNTTVYIDAGHSGWVDPAAMASRLSAANVATADGFSLNVSNFQTTSDNTSYGEQISTLAGNKHFIIDTSRNGNGGNGGQWCNPSGMAIGEKPTTSTSNSLIDAYLWIKTPGESDGTCNGGPSAGVWWPQYALSLIENAN